MAQGISVPQVQPNAPAFQVPTDLVNAYLARKQQAGEFNANQMADLGGAVNQMRQQQISNQLGALKTVADLYGAGGRRAVQSYAPQLNQMGGGQIIPQNPQQPPQPPQAQTMPTQPTQTAGAQDSSPSQQMALSAQMGHPMDPALRAFHAPQPQTPPVTAGAPNALGQSQSWNAPQPSAEDLLDIESGGVYGKNLAATYKDLGVLGMQPLTAQQKQNEIYNSQPLSTNQTEVLSNPKATSGDLSAAFPNGVPPSASASLASRSVERGKGSAEQQVKYNDQNQKLQAGFKALQDYSDALAAVPSSQKGAGSGMVTSLLGSPAGRAAPELVAANKARDAAIEAVGTALVPLERRGDSNAIRAAASSMPSVADDPHVVSAGILDLYKKMGNQLQLASSGAQSAAGSFGGKITPGQIPKLKTGGKIRVSNGKKSFMIDPADAAEAAKDGFK